MKTPQLSQITNNFPLYKLKFFCINPLEGLYVRRKSIIPYGEVSILSLGNLTPGTKFQLYAKVKSVSESLINISDDYEEFEFKFHPEMPNDLSSDEVILLFGHKADSEIVIEKILKTNLDWELYRKTRELESQ